MVLDLSSLEKAVDSLNRAIKVAESSIQGIVDSDQEEVIQAGVIQNFEFTYELCWKFMQRWLEKNVGPIIDRLTMKELFRMAAEHQLIKKVEPWFEYHQARNLTSHTYSLDIADEVYKTAIRFYKDAKKFLTILEERND
ncbi:MAG: nucleotidyltransferase substrate binding protein [Gammaproteobacteria bacterium]|nr:nucleotidyltransferase substrate binding protein [Gammaproteobacteria bacterium]MBU1926568.1 nucleotidyltransferase substrate binding protein [Gammaproteobacteria bacterium]